MDTWLEAAYEERYESDDEEFFDEIDWDEEEEFDRYGWDEE
ncbi:MAG: hypothetical protein WC965_01035 [Thiohalomonadaceae bacterium]